MLKKLLIGSVLLSTSLVSQAAIIDSMTAAELEGMSVTALFGDGSSEQFTWAATDAVSGGVTGTGWSLSLSGSTFGELDNVTDPSNPVLLGGWELVNTSADAGIVGLSLDASLANAYFDILDTVEYTPGSNVGREFFEQTGTAEATFSDSFSNIDLFGTLDINFTTALASGLSTVFVTDTDLDSVAVSEPATALVFLTGLLALVNFRRKS